MNLVVENCGVCHLRQGKYTCLGLDGRRDKDGVKRQIEGDQHHIRPDWCPLPVTITGETGIAKPEKKKPKGAPPPQVPAKLGRADRFFGRSKPD